MSFGRSTPLTSAEAHALIEQVTRLLAPLSEGEASAEPAPATERSRLLAAIHLLCPSDPLDERALDDFAALWTWVGRQSLFVWEVWPLPAAPQEDFQRLVLDGRPDLDRSHGAPGDKDDADGVAPVVADWLDDADWRRWVAIGHGHDGHRFLFFDPAVPVPTVWAIDNSAPTLVNGCWQGGEEIVRDLFIHSMLRTLAYRHPRPARPLPPREAWQLRVGCLLALAGLLALGWAIWH